MPLTPNKQKRKKEVDLISKINEFSRSATTSKNTTTIQSLHRQIESKSKEQVRIQMKIADIHKQIASKQKRA